MSCERCARLQAERDAARAERDKSEADKDTAFRVGLEQQIEIGRLREALKAISGYSGPLKDRDYALCAIARAALASKETK